MSPQEHPGIPEVVAVNQMAASIAAGGCKECERLKAEVERLRVALETANRWFQEVRVSNETVDVVRKALLEVERLRVEKITHYERADELRVENERLREALLPLLVVCEAILPVVEFMAECGIENKVAALTTHIERGRAALDGTSGKEPT
jgi:thiamine biosynthesis protein ThiC